MSKKSNAWTPADPGRVNAIDPAELDYWCREFDCRIEQFNAAIGAVAEHVTAIREELARMRKAG